MGTKLMALYTLLALFAVELPAEAQISSGGAYALQQSVIAGGGGDAAGGVHTLQTSTGEALAGATSTGGVYAVCAGFWTPCPFAPTAANVSISGRVLTGTGGIAGAVITIFGGTQTGPRMVRSNSFGNFTVSDIPSGHFYILTVEHKRFTFSPDTVSLSVVDDVTGIEFRAEGSP